LPQMCKNEVVKRFVTKTDFPQIYKSISITQFPQRFSRITPVSSKALSTYDQVDTDDDAQNGPHSLSEGLDKEYLFDYQTMPVAYIMDTTELTKLMEYSTIPPTPYSIEEFIARGVEGGVTEEENYTHLKKEVAIRLAHMLMELQHLPKELHKEERCYHTINLYSKSFSQIINFEEKEPDDQTLKEFMEILKIFKDRHDSTVNDMAKACVMMRDRLGIPTDDITSHMFSSIKTFLDRLYTSRISLRMITDQHLKVYGYERTPPHQIGVVHPRTSVTSILVDAYDDAYFQTENRYMVAPKVLIKNHNSSDVNNDTTMPVSGAVIPSHLYIIFYEVLKNAMRATVENNWDRKDDLPPITAIVCQADDDFTIKVSDQGGGVDRGTVEKLFYYLYTTTNQKHSELDRDLEDQGSGSGLPLARLYARYFHGDLRLASYEGYGTDVYIYARALSSTAVERLPVYNKDSVEAWSEEYDDDWTSSRGTGMMQAPEKIVVSPEIIVDTSVKDVMKGREKRFGYQKE